VTERFQLPPTPIEEITLDNGLRVVLSPDRTIPVVSIAVYYNVGSRNEKEGRTGFAHLFEHMMFQGSENVPKAAHFQYIFNAGGTMNGTTSTERTNYFETLPSNYLPLAFWLESDRMRSLKVTQENLDNQRNAVQEEKRLRYDNQPYVNAFLRMNELIFTNPAGGWPVTGWISRAPSQGFIGLDALRSARSRTAALLGRSAAPTATSRPPPACSCACSCRKAMGAVAG
jgi:predicted Zn-dependent peptidase